MADIYIVYKTTNTLNGMFYIGVHRNTNSYTSKNYLGSGIYLKRSVEKFGKDKFVRETLFDDLSKDEAYELESFIVCDKFLSRKDVYNLTVGGFGGSKKGRICKSRAKEDPTDPVVIARKALRSAKLKGRKASEETKRKQLEKKKGKCLIKFNAEVILVDVSEVGYYLADGYKYLNTGCKRKYSEQAKQNMRTAAKNRDNSKIGKYERTEEIRNKLSLSKKGKPGANKGKKIENTENMKKPKDPAKLLANKKSCIWCGKFVDPGNFKQFHGDNCKMKESNNG